MIKFFAVTLQKCTQISVGLRKILVELNLHLIKEESFNTEGGPIEAVEMMRVSEYLVTMYVA